MVRAAVVIGALPVALFRCPTGPPMWSSLGAASVKPALRHQAYSRSG